jgi:two-component system NtrC family sensor kinase
MKLILKIVLLVLLPVFANAQQSLPDSIRLKIESAPNDSILFRRNTDAAAFFSTINSDSALKYINKALYLTAKNRKRLQHASSLCYKAEYLMNAGRFAEAFSCLNESFRIAEDEKMETMEWIIVRTITPRIARLWRLSETHYRYGTLLRLTKNLEQAIFHNKEAIRIGNIAGGSWGPARVAYANMNLGIIYLQLKNPDSALLFFEEAKHLGSEQLMRTSFYGSVIAYEGMCYAMTGNTTKAKQFFYTALQISQAKNYPYNIAKVSNELSRIYLKENNKDSALFYALATKEQEGQVGTFITDELNVGLVYETLFLSYQAGKQNDSALKYSAWAIRTKDSIGKVQFQNLADFQKLLLEEQQRLQNIEKEKLTYQSKLRIYLLLAGLGVFLLIALILYRSNRKKQKDNQLLHQQKEEINSALSQLKSTQSQLIQSEKMASLGELTAGIAHEIQNPLNFVNNFSEVNKELADELEQEIDKGNTEDAKTLAKDIKENQEKILHHGKRADAIVKGMLQHSRSSSGVKEQTDINALADEYLRLAYHGLRAKDKSFNAKFETDFDNSIEKINVVPQEMGRVILNLINNAFYACAERSRSAVSENYEPKVTVSTKKVSDKIEISVKDNGSGIPQKVLDKIFQPFFTTKPTGQGTGLGLSLSYDIVKAHGGEIRVSTKEAEGTEFIINLPR